MLVLNERGQLLRHKAIGQHYGVRKGFFNRSYRYHCWAAAVSDTGTNVYPRRVVGFRTYTGH